MKIRPMLKWLRFRLGFREQCDAELKWKRGKGVAYCVRRMGHFGKHTTSNGIDF